MTQQNWCPKHEIEWNENSPGLGGNGGAAEHGLRGGTGGGVDGATPTTENKDEMNQKQKIYLLSTALFNNH